MNDIPEYEIIDAHAHIFPSKIAQKASVTIGEFYDTEMKYTGDSETILKSGGEIGVSKYLVCSTATVPQQTSNINSFIIDECNKHPEFIGFGTLHPETENMEAEIEKIIAGGLKGVKIHPDFQKFNIDDEKVFSIYELCEGRLPVLVHMGDDRYEFSRPHRLLNVIKVFPELKVIAAHFGGYQCWDEAIECLTDKENIYFDTSSTLGFIPLEKAKEISRHFDTDKLMFGTDFPMWDHKEELERFLSLGYSSEDNKKILSGNFKKIFNI